MKSGRLIEREGNTRRCRTLINVHFIVGHGDPTKLERLGQAGCGTKCQTQRKQLRWNHQGVRKCRPACRIGVRFPALAKSAVMLNSDKIFILYFIPHKKILLSQIHLTSPRCYRIYHSTPWCINCDLSCHFFPVSATNSSRPFLRLVMGSYFRQQMHFRLRSWLCLRIH